MKKIIYTFIFLLPLLLFACSSNQDETKTDTQPLEIIDTSNLIVSEGSVIPEIGINNTNTGWGKGIIEEMFMMTSLVIIRFENTNTGNRSCGIDLEDNKLGLIVLDDLQIKPTIYYIRNNNKCEINYLKLNDLIFKYKNFNYVTNIFLDFRENKINANNKYIGKSIGILGDISSVEYVKYGDQELPTVIIESVIMDEDLKRPKINCYLSSEEEAINLKRGSAIVVAGIFKSYIESEKKLTAHLKPCKVLDFQIK